MPEFLPYGWSPVPFHVDCALIALVKEISFHVMALSFKKVLGPYGAFDIVICTILATFS